MIKKEQVLKQLTDCGIVAVVRANSADEAIKICDACLAGGCTGIELTFTVPGADKVIAALADKYKNGEMMLGAGTVLDPETARAAILAGANFIVSPAFNAETAKLCNRYRDVYKRQSITTAHAGTAQASERSTEASCGRLSSMLTVLNGLY